MTYFLNEFNPSKVDPARGRDVAPSTFGEGLSAATSQMMRDTNANFMRQRQVSNERLVTAEPAARRIGIEALNQRFEERGAGYDHLRPAPATVDDFISMHGQEGVDMALDLARELATTNPDAWSDLDTSDESVEARVTKRRVADDADEQAILDMMPSGRGAAALLGGIAGAFADVRNIPFLFAGSGGGSFLKVLGREAIWGGVAEAVTLPSQYAVAEELGKPDPNPVAAIAFGAAGGAILGGGVEAIARAARYYRGRSELSEPLPGLDGPDSEIVVGAAEAALLRGDDPAMAVQRAIDDAVEFTTDFDLDTIFAASRATAEPDLAIRMNAEPDQFRLPRSETAIPVSPDLPRVDTGPAVQNAERYRAARETDPEAFAQLEQHQVRAQTYRRWLAEMGDQQDSEVSDLLTSIDQRETSLASELATMRTGGRRRVRERIKQVQGAREEALTLSGRRETPDMQKVRRQLLVEDQKMRDLGPRLARAYAASRPASPEASIEAAWRTFARPQPEGWVPTFPVQRQAVSPARAGNQAQVQPAVPAMAEISSPEAKALRDTIATDMRDRIDAEGDFVVNLEDGRGARKASTILDDLDQAEEFNAVLEACGKPRRPE